MYRLMRKRRYSPAVGNSDKELRPISVSVKVGHSTLVRIETDLKQSHAYTYMRNTYMVQ